MKRYTLPADMIKEYRWAYAACLANPGNRHFRENLKEAEEMMNDTAVNLAWEAMKDMRNAVKAEQDKIEGNDTTK